MCDSNLGVYGDVIRVKILYNKRDSALIQFKEAQQTQTGELAVSDPPAHVVVSCNMIVSIHTLLPVTCISQF